VVLGEEIDEHLVVHGLFLVRRFVEEVEEADERTEVRGEIQYAARENGVLEARESLGAEVGEVQVRVEVHELHEAVHLEALQVAELEADV
jgi:hypothetical protein